MMQALAPSAPSPDERVYAAIYNAVQGQRLAPGIKLKEVELAQLFKVSRTSVVEIYGVRTLLNGTLLPAPHIGRRNASTIRAVREAGFELPIERSTIRQTGQRIGM